MPTRHESLAALSEYEARMRAAIAQDEHHDQRRAILQELLRDGFGLTVEEITLEQNVRVEKTRGRIDLLYRSLAWEVKRDLDREREDLERELTLYLSDLGPGAIGIGTDGLRFEAYQLDAHGVLRITDTVSIDGAEAADQILDWLDAYVFALDDVAPTTENTLARFGLESPVFQTAEIELAELWERVSSDASAALKREEWERLLEVVYGTQIADDQLWLRHTYLVMVARLLAYLAIVERLPVEGQELGALTGELFAPLGLPNLVERDFFAWPALDQVASDAKALLRRLANHLGLFAVGSVDEDLLKELYEHMVDPAEREWLGEFYTPDWLADLVLERAGFSADTRMVDPACGSGTFLFAAIRRLRKSGLSGQALVHAVRENVAGFDVHPLAVTIARANYVLALKGDVREAQEDVVIPVFMADSLAAPEAGFGRMVEIAAPVDGLPVPEPPEPALPARFQLPTEHDPAQAVNLAQIVDLVDQLSDPGLDPARAAEGLAHRLQEWSVTSYADVWQDNLRLLRALRANHRDTIWSFVLTNAARPHEIAADPVALVVGNPPWLTIREMAGSEYRERVRKLADEFNLVPGGGARMAHVSHIDTATVFAMYCAEHFLPESSGRVAFVLPRSVMAGATQHRNFREGRAALLYAPVAAIDLDAVDPLFRIPACVMTFDKVGQGERPLPPWKWDTTALSGTLPRKNASRAEADAALTEGPAEEAAFPSAPSPYLADTEQGVDIRPRAFWLVELDPNAQAIDQKQPYLRSDQVAVQAASPNYRGVSLNGRVESRYLYATATRIDPFRLGALRLAALPIVEHAADSERPPEERRVTVLSGDEILARGDAGMATWITRAEEQLQAGLARADQHWNGTVVDYLNTQHKLARQRPRASRVVWGKGGSHPRAAVPSAGIKEHLGLDVHGFVVDLSCYGIACESDIEAHYLCAMVNSATVDEAITYHQTRGEQGPRDIHRRPVEHVPIPRFDAQDERHLQLAELSVQAHTAAVDIDFTSERNQQRYLAALGAPMNDINEIARGLLMEAFQALA